MRIALIVHGNECGSWKSFYVKNGGAYLLDTETPYFGSSEQQSIGNSIFRNVWNYAFLNDGYFINPNQGLPDLELDVIIAVSEMPSSNKKQFIDSIRTKYKNSIIVGTAKDTVIWKYNITDGLVNNNSVDMSFFNLCDKVTLPLNDIICNDLSNRTGVKIYSLPYAYKIDNIRSLIPNNGKEKSILVGCNSWTPVRGYDKCLEFSKIMADKYDYNLIENTDEYSWKEWLNIISKTSCVINMDRWSAPGQVTIESIMLGTPTIGGYSDASLAILPEYSTNDFNKLEEIFVEVTNKYDNKDRFSKLKSLYSVDSVINKLETIIND